MKNGISKIRKAGVGVLAALTAVVGFVPLIAEPADAASNVTSVRYGGVDRFDTAKIIAAAFGASGTVIVARGDIYPDALAGAYAARLNSAPMLLTRTDSIPQTTTDAINASGATKIILLGGTQAISTAVETSFRSGGKTVERISGATRFDTAAAIATAGPADQIGNVGTPPVRTALLATGLNFPDALAGSPLAYASRLPILLTTPTALSPQARAALSTLAIKQVMILGGPAAVSETVAAELTAAGYTVSRQGGADRAETSVKITDFGIQNGIFTNRRVGLARGDLFPDALAYGPLGGKDRATIAPAALRAVDPNATRNGVILSNSPTDLGNAARAWCTANAPTLTIVEALGGEAAMSQATVQQCLDAAKTPTTGTNASTSSLSADRVAPGGTTTLTVSGSGIRSITYTVCGGASQTLTGATATGGTTSIQIPATQAAGTCNIVVTTTFADGTTKTETKSITVDPAASSVSLSPTSGPTGTSTTLTITGSKTPTAVTVTSTNCTIGSLSGTGATRTFTVSGAANTVCNLSVPVTFSDGTNQTFTPTFTITAAGQQTGTIAVSPTGPQTKTISTIGTGTSTDTQGVTAFTVTGLTGPVDIVLIACDQLLPGSGVVFSNANSNTFADRTALAAAGTVDQGGLSGPPPGVPITPFLAQVNGLSTLNLAAPWYANNVAPVNGVINFTVDSNTANPQINAAPDCVYPLVFVDANNNNVLEINPVTGAAVEAFGLGSRLQFVPRRATDGNFGTAAAPFTVTSTDKTNNVFSACTTGALNNATFQDPFGPPCFSFAYDPNDTFNVGVLTGAGANASMTTFTAALSPGDRIWGSYANDTAAPSNFNMADTNPLPPGGITVLGSATAGATSIVIRWNDSITPTADSYRIMRQIDPTPNTACPVFTGNNVLPTDFVTAATVLDRSGTTAGDPTYEYTDTGLTAGTKYCYVILTVDDGDTSVNSSPGTAAAATAEGCAGPAGANGLNPSMNPPAAPGTLCANGAGTASTTGTGIIVPGGVAGAPIATDMRVQDNGVIGILDINDRGQIIFNEPMNPSAAAPGATYRFTDADNTVVDIICGSFVAGGGASANAICSWESGGNYNGSTFLTGQVIRFVITANPGAAGTAGNQSITGPGGTQINSNGLIQAGTITNLQYPGTLTNVNSQVVDANEGLVLSVANSTDKTLDASSTPNHIQPAVTGTPGADTTAPVLGTGHTASAAGAGNITLVFNEPVQCNNNTGPAAPNPPNLTATGGVVITGCQAGGGNTLVLSATGIPGAGVPFTVTYTPSGCPAPPAGAAAGCGDDIFDLNFNPAAGFTTGNITFGTAPAPTPPSNLTGANPSSGPAGSQFTVSGTNLDSVTNVTVCAVAATSTFAGTAASGTRTITAPANPTGSNCVVALTNPSGTANAPTNFTYTAPAPPTIVSATYVTDTNFITVDFTQAVTSCPTTAAALAAWSFANQNNDEYVALSPTGSPTSVTLSGGDCRLNYAQTFRNNDRGALTYNQPGAPADQASNANGSVPTGAANVPDTIVPDLFDVVSATGTAVTVRFADPGTTFLHPILCSSLTANGSEYVVAVNNVQVIVNAAVCPTPVNGQDDRITFTLNSALVAGQTVTVTAQNGTDGNTVRDAAGNFEVVGDTVSGTAT